MEISQRTLGDVTILDLKGRLILGDGEQAFRQIVDELVERGQKKFLVNFEGVTYLDSAGVGAVVWKYVTLHRRGGTLKLLRLRPRSFEVLSVTKVLTVLELFESEAEAVRSFSEPAQGARPS